MASPDSIKWTYVTLDHSLSDGIKEMWPTDPKFKRPDDSLYREKIAKMWMLRRDEYEPGEHYILEKLPEGYALFDRPRPSNPDIRDKYLWGHPSGAYFNSPNRFFPHFYWFITGRQTQCQCDLCINQRKKETHPQPKMKGKEAETEGRKRRSLGGNPPDHSRSRSTPVDPEGNPDVWKIAIQKLKEKDKEGEGLELKIKELDNIEWTVQKKHLASYLEDLGIQPSWVPRAGEIVLWVPHLKGDLRYNKEKGRIQMYDTEKDEWLGTPEWRAGTVGQVPKTDPVKMQDIEKPTKKEWEVNYSGFRVETFPDPNSINKAQSLQYRYVHLNSIKPFNYYHSYLNGIPQNEWHPSISFALTVMSSFSLLGKNTFIGDWPDASIYCSGIWIGAELYVNGDAIRLKPKGYTLDTPAGEVTDVMVISDIRMDLTNCIDDIKSPQLAEKHSVRLEGKIYTLSPERAYRAAGRPPTPLTDEELSQYFRDVGIGGWGKWYHQHDPAMESEISQDMVIGRLYDPFALALYMRNDGQKPIQLGLDLFSVIYARWFSRQRDQRIPEGKDWFWGDYRTQSLGIDSLNGEDVGIYSDARNPKMWRGILRCIEGSQSKSDIRDAKIPMDRGRPLVGNNKSSFADIGKTSKLVSTGLGDANSGLDGSSGDDYDEDDEDSEEDEDESEDEDSDEDTVEDSDDGDDIPFA